MVFWGMPIYRDASRQHALAPQFSVLRLVGRHEGLGLRVPQFGWLRHRASERADAEPDGEILLNEYARTHRWEKLLRDEDAGCEAPAREQRRDDVVQHCADRPRPVPQTDGAQLSRSGLATAT